MLEKAVELPLAVQAAPALFTPALRFCCSFPTAMEMLEILEMQLTHNLTD